jgi:hypothetical protein
MKFFTSLIVLFMVVGIISTAELGPICPEAVECSENLSCIEGFKILTHNENCCCVKMDVAESSEAEESPEVAPTCPEAVECSENLKCHEGFKILTHNENCCCVKMDVFNDADGDGYADIKVCPMCAPEETGQSDCECITPLTKFTSTIDSSLHCCEQDYV